MPSSKQGKRLAEIHVHYEDQPEYPLKKIEKPGKKLDYSVTKMHLSKDKTQIAYNDFLTLSGVPPEIFEYASATAPPSTGSLTSTKSQPTSGAASPTTPTAPTIRPTSSASSVRSSPLASKP